MRKNILIALILLGSIGASGVPQTSWLSILLRSVVDEKNEKEN